MSASRQHTARARALRRVTAHLERHHYPSRHARDPRPLVAAGLVTQWLLPAADSIGDVFRPQFHALTRPAAVGD